MLKLLAVESEMIYEEVLEEIGRPATICGGKAFRVRTLLQMRLFTRLVETGSSITFKVKQKVNCKQKFYREVGRIEWLFHKVSTLIILIFVL